MNYQFACQKGISCHSLQIHMQNSCEKVFSKMAKMKKTPYRKSRVDDGARPGTSKEGGEGAKKFEKKGEHSKWISFLNDFNMQYIPIKIIVKEVLHVLYELYF